jgi:AmiR/NasT family two-component response regulator
MLAEKTITSVLIVSGTEKILSQLSELLPCSSFSPVDYTKDCSSAKRKLISASYDIVIVNAPLSDEFGTEFALDVVHTSPSSVILLVKNELYEDVSCKVEAYGVITVSKPVSRTIIYSAIKLAIAMRGRLKSLEAKNKTLMAKMGEIRIVNRAKWVLIKYLNMSEEQAHRFIEKQAMDMRLTKREIAENIIRTYEN